MNARERVRNTIDRKPTDTIPYGFDMTGRIKEGLARHYGVSTENVQSFIGDNLLYVAMKGPLGYQDQDLGDGTYRDEFGLVWDRGEHVRDMGDWGGILSSPLVEPSLAGYPMPDGSAPGRFDALLGEELKNDPRYKVLHLDGLLDVAWHIRGFENFMMDMATDDGFADELLDRSLAFLVDVIGQVPDIVDGIRFGEDWGQQKGLFMGGPHWRGLLKPRLATMYAAARSRGLDVLIHSCGDIAEIFPDLIEIGVQVVHPIQPEVMDVAFLKREYGKDLILYGGLGCQSTIPLGTVAQVLEEAKERVALLSEGGGYIFGPAGAIPTEAPLENVIALVEFARNGYR